MADRSEDAASPVADPVTAGVRCPLLVIDETDLPSTANRCAASRPPASVSLGQQRLVCFDPGHVDCPRFVRATGSTRGGSGRPIRAATVAPIAVASVMAVAPDPQVPAPIVEATPATEPTPGPVVRVVPVAPVPPVVPVAPVVRSSRRSGARPARSKPRPIIVASAILVVALILAFAFTSLRGGLAMPSPGASGDALASPGAAASSAASPIVSPVVSPSDSPSEAASAPPSESPSPGSSPSPSLSPTPTLTTAPTATPIPPPPPSLPTAYQGLKPCPDLADCYLYRIHPGDSLIAIAKRFGITIVALKAANPEIKDPSLLQVGARIRIPLPTS